MDLASPRDFSHTLEIQGALEAFAARLAAQHGINSAQRVLLQQYVASMEEIAVAFGAWSMDFLDRYADMSQRFHLLVFELAQSSILQRHVAEDFVNQFAFVDRHALTQAHVDALRKFMLFEQDQHRSLIEAIVQRNSIHAEDLVREHTSFNQKFFALWEDGILALTKFRTLSSTTLAG